MSGQNWRALLDANPERNPFDDDDVDEGGETDAEKAEQEPGGGAKPPPDHLIGAEILHPDETGRCTG